MPNDGILPQFANIVCTQCYTTYTNRKLQKFTKLLAKLIFEIYFIQKQFREN